MRRLVLCGCALALLSLGVSGRTVRAQGREDVPPRLLDHGALVEAIARAEDSVVAIALVAREDESSRVHSELRPSPFGFPVQGTLDVQPMDRGFVPDRYGTGVVIDSAGLVLTACHVLAEGVDYYVSASDRRVFTAKVLAADPRSDLAVLSIDAAGLKPIRFGDASTLKKGQIVVALGNPHAIARDGEASASWGIVSNLARKAPTAPIDSGIGGQGTLHQLGTLIQTDARLTFGTSGGPLIDLEGRMVGLTTSLAAVAGYESAAGYAFPVDDVFRRMVGILSQGREVEYGFLGVQPADVSWAERAEGLRGARVGSVVHGTPADRYGLVVGDLITAVNGKPVVDADSMILEIGRLPLDSLARLTVQRDGRSRSLDVGLTKYPIGGQKVVTSFPPTWRGARVDYTSAGISFDEWLDLGLRYVDDGVVVADVTEETAAWNAGLRDGMVISRVNGAAVRSPSQFRSLVRRETGPVQLRLVSRDKSVRDLWIDAP